MNSRNDATSTEVTYQEWLEMVDAFLIERAGLDQDCMGDWLSRDTYDEGATVRQGAKECLAAQETLTDEDIERLTY